MITPKPYRAALPAALALSLAACAQTPAPDADEADRMLADLDTSRACFMQREVRGYSDAPDASSANERILVDTGLREQFLLETTGPCPELDFSLGIALDNRTAGSVCTGDLETIVIPSRVAGGSGICPVRVLGRLRED